MISANTGVNFLVMISTMNTAIMANPSNTSTGSSFVSVSNHGRVMSDTHVRVVRVTRRRLRDLIDILLIGNVLRIYLSD
jgi:hypothetical protein